MMWYVLVNEEQLGPMDRDEVQDLYSQGVIQEDTLIWKEGYAEWVAISGVIEFSDLQNPQSFQPSDESEEDGTLIASASDADLMAAVAQYLDDSVDDEPASEPVMRPVEQPTIAAAYDFPGETPTSPRKLAREDSIVSLSLSGAMSELIEDSSLDGIPQIDEPLPELTADAQNGNSLAPEELKDKASKSPPSDEKGPSHGLVARPTPSKREKAEDLRSVTPEPEPLVADNIRLQDLEDIAAIDDRPTTPASQSVHFVHSKEKPTIVNAQSDYGKEASRTQSSDLKRTIMIALVLMVIGGGGGAVFMHLADNQKVGLDHKQMAPTMSSSPSVVITQSPTKKKAEQSTTAKTPSTDAGQAIVRAADASVAQVVTGSTGGTKSTGEVKANSTDASVTTAPDANALIDQAQMAASSSKNNPKVVEGNQIASVKPSKKQMVKAAEKISAVKRKPPQLKKEVAQKKTKARKVKRRSSTKKRRRNVRSKTKVSSAPRRVRIATRRPKRRVKKSNIFGTTTKAKKLPITLGRKDITRVLKTRKRDLETCVGQNKELKGRLISVSVRILRSGRVQRARILTSWMRGKKEAKCIEARVKAYRFPAFRGDPMSIPLPIRL